MRTSTGIYRVMTHGVLPAVAMSFLATGANAGSIKYQKSVTLNVGQSTTLKGVRNRNCGRRTPSWSSVSAKLPSISLGRFFNGGAGTTYSRSCGGDVPARAVGFKATKPGTQRVRIFGDTISITVK